MRKDTKKLRNNREFYEKVTEKIVIFCTFAN